MKFLVQAPSVQPPCWLCHRHCFSVAELVLNWWNGCVAKLRSSSTQSSKPHFICQIYHNPLQLNIYIYQIASYDKLWWDMISMLIIKLWCQQKMLENWDFPNKKSWFPWDFPSKSRNKTSPSSMPMMANLFTLIRIRKLVAPGNAANLTRSVEIYRGRYDRYMIYDVYIYTLGEYIYIHDK